MSHIRNELLKIAGIGEKNVEKYMEKILKKNPKPTKEDIRKILLTFPELSVVSKADIIYNPCKKIENVVIKEIHQKMYKILGDVYTVAGSYRRGAKYSSDIDIIHFIPFSKLKKQFNDGDKKNKILDPIASGKKKNLTYILWKGTYYKIDFYKSTKKEYPYMLLYLTGNFRFNLYMRNMAKKKGMLLNQYGLYKDDKLISAKTEKDIFDKIGLRWREPHERSF